MYVFCLTKVRPKRPPPSLLPLNVDIVRSEGYCPGFGWWEVSTHGFKEGLRGLRGWLVGLIVASDSGSLLPLMTHSLTVGDATMCPVVKW